MDLVTWAEAQLACWQPLGSGHFAYGNPARDLTLSLELMTGRTLASPPATYVTMNDTRRAYSAFCLPGLLALIMKTTTRNRLDANGRSCLHDCEATWP